MKAVSVTNYPRLCLVSLQRIVTIIFLFYLLPFSGAVSFSNLSV